MNTVLKGIDCTTKLNAKSASVIKEAGYDYVIRYLGATDWKRYDKPESDAIIQAGLKLVSVWEGGSTKDSYFTYDRGKTDALFANQYAKQVGLPSGSAIYFAVDYDCHNFNAVKAYFKGVKANLDKSFKVGVYGSYDVVMGLKGYVDYYWQTYAWSRGKVADHIHMHQYKNGQQVSGIEVDLNNILKSPGHWEGKKMENNSTWPDDVLKQFEEIYKTLSEEQKKAYVFTGMAHALAHKSLIYKEEK